jgi:hypothetical protein
MVNYDLYAILSDIKAEQTRNNALLAQLLAGHNPESIYAIKDLALRLNVSVRTIMEWKKQGILPHSQINGKVFISESQVQILLERFSNNSPDLDKQSVDERRNSK